MPVEQSMKGNEIRHLALQLAAQLPVDRMAALAVINDLRQLLDIPLPEAAPVALKLVETVAG